ncbi:hypothetical protein bhYOR_000818 [Borrelia nietonii YOR]|nr:hypothetical protein [Borrelia nietonii]UPA09484.1 hypothetical protein bhYOR_000818 [Borrelia nietonii YOR]
MSNSKIEFFYKIGFSMLRIQSIIDLIGSLCNLDKKSFVSFCYLNKKIL